MEPFSEGGWFWLPQSRDRRVPGDLVFDGAGVQLHVSQTLRGPVIRGSGCFGGGAEWASEPVIHGLLRGGSQVTLLQASGLAVPVDVADEAWSAAFLLRGGLVTDDCFSRVRVVFDYLQPWTRPAGILRSALAASNFMVDAGQKVLAAAPLADGRVVRLYTGVAGQYSDTSVHLDQWCAFEVEGEATPLLDILNDWMRPLQDLLVVCLGLPIRIEDVLVGTGPELTLSFNAVQPPATGRALEHPGGYAVPTLLTYQDSPLTFNRLIREWFELCDRLPAAVTRLCGPFYASFIYSQHRFASTFQSAEAVATAVLRTREKTPSEHRRRIEAVRAVLDASELDADTVSWATRVLQSRNDKPLRQLIEEMIAATGDMGAQLLAAMPDVAQRAVEQRVGVSHPRDGRGGTLERYWLGESLVWVVRVHLLAQLGVDMAYLSERVTAKPTFQEVVTQLGALAGEGATTDAQPATQAASTDEQDGPATPVVS